MSWILAYRAAVGGEVGQTVAGVLGRGDAFEKWVSAWGAQSGVRVRRPPYRGGGSVQGVP
jgi:hypothetical protein